MSIGSGESAVLQVEVDDAAFDRGMERINASTKRAQDQMIAGENRLSDAAVRAAARRADAAERAAERQEKANERANKKALVALGVATYAWKKFFDFIASGSGESSKAVEHLAQSAAVLKDSVASATAQSLRPLVDVLESITGAANSSSAAVTGLGRTIAMLALGPAGGVGLVGARMLGGAPSVTATNIGPAAPSLAALQGAQGANTLPVGVDPEDLFPGRRGGGGGGGGGESDAARQTHMLAEFNRQLADRARFWEEVRKAADAAHAAEMDRQRDAREAILDENVRRAREENQRRADALQVSQDARAEKDRFYADEAVENERRRQEALMATVAAMETVNQVLLKGGPAAQGVARVLMAVQAVIYAQKAAGEVAEALAAAARYDTWAAVGHAAAAVQFGVAAGMKLGAAVGGPSGGSRAAPSGGGGGAYAAPRSADGQQGMGPVSITMVVNASGEVVDDSALRRWGRTLSEVMRRGYYSDGNGRG